MSGPRWVDGWMERVEEWPRSGSLLRDVPDRLSRIGAPFGMSFGLKVTRSFEQGAVGHVDQPSIVEAVEGGAQAGAIGAELTQLDPVTSLDIGRQHEGASHEVGAVTGRAVEGEGLLRRLGNRSGRADHTGRELEGRH